MPPAKKPYIKIIRGINPIDIQSKVDNFCAALPLGDFISAQPLSDRGSEPHKKMSFYVMIIYKK